MAEVIRAKPISANPYLNLLPSVSFWFMDASMGILDWET